MKSTKTNIIIHIRYISGVESYMERITKLRKEKGLNQVGLGLKLNVSQKMISSYESGIHQPSIDTLIQMADFFGVSVDYLLGISNIRVPADKFAIDSLNEREIELLDLFKELDRDKQQKAIGILFALKEY